MSNQEAIHTDPSPGMLERIDDMLKGLMTSMRIQGEPMPYAGGDKNLYADTKNLRFPIANAFGEISKHWMTQAIHEVEKLELQEEQRIQLGTHLFTEYTRAEFNDEELIARILAILRSSEPGISTEISVQVNPQQYSDFSETEKLYEFPLAVQFSATEEEDGLAWRTILRTGTWAVAPSMKTRWNNGSSLVITPERIEELKASFDMGAFEYVTVPDTHKETPLNNRGFVKAMKITPDEDRDGHYKLQAGFDITNEDAKKAIIEGSLAGVSCGIIFDHTRKSDGKVFGAAIHHVALTNQPWIEGLGGWEKIAASEYNVATVELVGTEENEVMEQQTEVDVNALQTQLAELQEQNRRLQLSTMRSEVKDMLNKYQKEKNLSPAVLTAIEPILLSAKMQDTKVLTLADDGSSTNEINLEAALSSFLDAMPAQMDLTDPQSTNGEPISADQSKPETSDNKVELSAAEKAAAIRAELGLDLAEGEAK